MQVAKHFPHRRSPAGGRRSHVPWFRAPDTRRRPARGPGGVRPRVGTFVAVLSRRELTELFQMRELLEGAAVRLLVFRGNVPEPVLLEANMRAARASGQLAPTGWAGGAGSRPAPCRWVRP
jgi:hypothetical protein